ncbi:MAG: pilus assembly protein PilP [Nitrospirota bacterium]
MRKLILPIILILFMIPNSGCKKEQPALQKPLAEKVSPSAETALEKGAEEARGPSEEEYKYDSKGRRDPFLSLVAVTKQKPEKKKGASPFESYDIEEIKLLATAWDEDKHYALIMLPNQKSYTITEGMTLGLLGGKVVKITSDSVIVREFVKDYRGDIKPKDSILKLHKGDEE